MAKEEDEDKLWSLVTKDVKPIKANHVLNAKSKKLEKNKPDSKKENESDHTRLKQEKKAQLQKQPPSKGLDRKTKEKLRKGSFRIEATLDLHGYTKSEAFEKLISFLINARRANKRWVLVITGKGQKKANTGIIKQSMPEWLHSPLLEESVLGFNTAKPKDGGEGAFYILLRKNVS